ncbi:MAG: hypothetical protein QOE29_737 [Gaiellaceae bacterium]|jgi:hypothetical protein|nr:hypothetical protein [Gaiellaceae bacterium]
MGRLTFIVPALVGGAVGIGLAASHEGLGVIVVVALVALVAALVAAPLLLRELTHRGVSGQMPPYARVREELAARSFRGPSLAHTRDLLALAGNAYDLHFRFRPLLVDVVADLLALRARIDFHDHPEQAQELLGAELWDLVRPDRPVPEGRFSDEGLDQARLERLLVDLEALAA